MSHHYHSLLEGGITMTKKEFIKEHKRLIKALKSGKPELLMKELKEQREELKKYTGGRAGVSKASGFIQRLMSENKWKHSGQYKNPTWALHKDSKMSAPAEFDWKKLATPEQGGLNTQGKTDYGASPFILKHYSGKPQQFHSGTHPKGYYPQETATQRKARIKFLMERLQKIGVQVAQQRQQDLPVAPQVVRDAQNTFAEIIANLQPSTGNQVVRPMEGLEVRRREEEEQKEEPPQENQREEQPVATPPPEPEVPKEKPKEEVKETKVIKWTIPEDEIEVYSTEDMPRGEAKKWEKLILISKYLGSQAWRIDDVKPREVKEYLESKGWTTGLDSSNLSKGIKEATEDLKDTDVWEEYSSTAEIRDRYKEPTEQMKTSVKKIIEFMRNRKKLKENREEGESEQREFQREEQYKVKYETALYRWCKMNKCPALADFVAEKKHGSTYTRYMEGELGDAIEVLKPSRKGQEDATTIRETDEFYIHNWYQLGYEGKVVFKSGFEYSPKRHKKVLQEKYGYDVGTLGFDMVLDYSDEFYVSLIEESDIWFRHEALDLVCYVHHIDGDHKDDIYAPVVNKEGKLVYFRKEGKHITGKDDEEFLEENPEERPKFEPAPPQTSPYFLGNKSEKKEEVKVEVKEEVKETPKVKPRVIQKKKTREERFVELRREFPSLGLKKIGEKLKKEGYDGVSASNLSIINDRLVREGKAPTYKELSDLAKQK